MCATHHQLRSGGGPYKVKSTNMMLHLYIRKVTTLRTLLATFTVGEERFENRHTEGLPGTFSNRISSTCGLPGLNMKLD